LLHFLYYWYFCYIFVEFQLFFCGTFNVFFVFMLYLCCILGIVFYSCGIFEVNYCVIFVVFM